MNKLKSLLKGKPYLEKWEDIKNLPWEERKVGVSDFTLANGSWSSQKYTTLFGIPTCLSFLADCCFPHNIYSLDSNGDEDYSYPNRITLGLAPSLRFNLPNNLVDNYNPKAVFGCDIFIRELKYTERFKKGTYHTITFANTRGFGKKVDNTLTQRLQALLNYGELKKAGQISGKMNSDQTFKKFNVYKYEGKEYAYVEATPCDGGGNTYLDDTPIINRKMVFIELQPATLIIRTPWEDLPKYINPNGTGKATELVVRVQNAVNGGVPFSKSGNTNYNSEECDARHYVENEFMQEFFIDDENEATSTYNTHLEEEQQ